jgi:uncharacterized protein YjbJ (UPF0337 family)
VKYGREHHGTLQEHHSSLRERVDYLEKLLNDSADRHAKELTSHAELIEGGSAASSALQKSLEELRRNHESVATEHGRRKQHHTALVERVDALDRLLNETADKHSRDLATHGRNVSVEKEGRDKAHGSLQKMLEDLREELVGEIAVEANTRNTEVKELQSGHKVHISAQEEHARNHAKLAKELQLQIASEKELRDGHHSALREQIGDLQENWAKERGIRDGHHGKLQARLDDLQRKMHDEILGEAALREAFVRQFQALHNRLEEKVKEISVREAVVDDDSFEHFYRYNS